MEQIISNYKKGFRKGVGQIQLKYREKIIRELWEALGIANRISFYQYRDGMIEPKASQAEALEIVFAKYGITEIWGE